MTILERRGLVAETRDRVERLLAGLDGEATSDWCCHFPAVAGPDAPAGMIGGILTVAASDPGILPPRASRPAISVLDPEGLAPIGHGEVTTLSVSGLPMAGAGLVLGRSGSAAAWLAARARATGRHVPRDIVVSADLISGPGGEPRLAAVRGVREKAAVVARELPNARLLLCGEHDGASHVTAIPEGTSVKELERLVWGNAAATDRAEVLRVATAAREAFDAHDYQAAAPRYEQVVHIARPDDMDLTIEACLRLGEIAVHHGRPEEAGAWFARSDGVALPPAKRGRYVVERLAGLAGRAIDAFQPQQARELLGTTPARRAADPECHDPWERIQVLGAWRRLHLLEGHPAQARSVQKQLLAIAEGPERPRALLDLAWTEIRCGEFAGARSTLCEARRALHTMSDIYQAQSLGFLTWYTGRLALRGADVAGLADLLVPEALNGVLSTPHLQAAARWRVEALRAARVEDGAALQALAQRCTPFQRWYLGVFLVEVEHARLIGVWCMATSEIDLSGMPALHVIQAQLREGEPIVDKAVSQLAAY